MRRRRMRGVGVGREVEVEAGEGVSDSDNLGWVWNVLDAFISEDRCIYIRVMRTR